MLIFLGLLTACYLIVGHVFLKLFLWFCQDPNLISMQRDPLYIKVGFWILALIIWPSFLFDLGEHVVKRFKQRRL